ncbi:MAG: transglycosylase domain-containing protein [Lentimicrobiaceae bacterium]|nr:transglycosylase domain-containing protein [Lentimicrobiaceae bacterium]
MSKDIKGQTTWVKRFWLLYIASIVFVILLFTMISLGWLGFMPSFEELENPKSNLASEVISADQELLGKFYIENRSIIHYEELSPWLIKALIATEDARFYKHSGVDPKAVFRVMFGIVTGNSKGGGSTISQQLAKNLFPRKPNRTFVETVFTKLKEWVTATKLERNYTKNEIIAMYLNTVDFGSLSFGIKSAAKTYFNKSPDSLNVEESALLIGILKAPSFYSPIRNPERALKRREVVLNQMRKHNYLTEEQYDSVRQTPIDMKHYSIQDHTSGLATYFREYLRKIMYAEKPDEDNYDDKEDYSYDSLQWETNPLYGWINKNKKPDGSKYNLYKDGLKIYTTLNSKMQEYAEEAVKEHLKKELQPSFFKHWKGVKGAPFDVSLGSDVISKIMKDAMHRSDRYHNLKRAGMDEDEIQQNFKTPTLMQVFTWNGDRDTLMSPWDSIRYYKYFLQAGLMSMEPQTGFVRAYVGGIDYQHFQYDHITQGRRQVGSTFKPFVYTLAMQEGEFSPCSKVPNVQQTVELPSGDKWEPKNSDHDREGEMVTLRWALANSVNWVSAYLIKRYSPEAVVKMAHKMGVKSYIPPVYSICLGTADLKLNEMVGAMSCFPNKGIYTEPIFVTRIEDKNGNLIAKFVPNQEEAMSEQTAYLMLTLMKGVVENGTGARLRYKYGLNNPIAGKTGTTQNNSDGWFMGLTPNLVTGVWVGNEDRSVHFRSILLGQGATMALPIFALYMKKIYADPSLHISVDDFEKPADELTVEIDCNKYVEKQGKSSSSGSSQDIDKF